ncbi:MAG: rhomboid family intramembrane serine protease [Streptosporangiales bacterium]
MDRVQTRAGRHWTDRAPGALLVVGLSLAVLWLVEIVDTVLGHRLDAYGIRPRVVDGLDGIAFAPFLHAGFSHLLANSTSFAILGVVAYMAVNALRFFGVIVVSAVTSGFGAWLFGAVGTVVVGASGVIFGLLGFLLVRGFIERRVGAIAVSVAVLLLYGTALLGVLPGAPHVSWQGHLFGFAGGVLAAWVLRQRRRRCATTTR